MTTTNARERTPVSDATAAQIRAERAAAGLSQEAVYTSAGIGRSTYLRLESGERVADVSQIGHLCDALGLELPTFFERAMARVTDSRVSTGHKPALNTAARGFVGKKPQVTQRKSHQDH